MQDTLSKTQADIAARRYRQSSSFRMALLVSILLGACALTLGYLLYNFSHQNLIRETEDAINAEINNIVYSWQFGAEKNVAELIGQRISRRAHPFYLYQSPSNEWLAGNITSLPEDFEWLGEGIIRSTLKGEHMISQSKGPPRRVAVKVHVFPDRSRLLVARDIEDIMAGYERMVALCSMMILLMFSVILVSFFISTIIVRRINTIAHTARRIMETGDLSRRIHITNERDDLGNLAQLLNALLERIDELMQGVREVVDNIAHDLRTPLNQLRNQLEDMKKSSKDPELADELLSKADQLLDMFNALLRIANIEKGKRRQTTSNIDLEQLLLDVLELYEPLAEERNIRLTSKMEHAPTYFGDRNLLFQAFANLIDNAIKFTDAGGAIMISYIFQNNIHFIEINDTGPGIAEKERKKVFTRFYRTDNSRNLPGHGLGLSLVKAVIDLHQGTIILGDAEPGLRVNITL